MNDQIKQALAEVRGSVDHLEQLLDTQAPAAFSFDLNPGSNTSTTATVPAAAPEASGFVETIDTPAPAGDGANPAQQDIVPPTLPDPSASSETEPESSQPSSNDSAPAPDGQPTDSTTPAAAPEPPDTAGL